MAEITNNPNDQKGPGVKKSVKLSTRVDLTPMVDLGFLLITFFIFTTNMSKPTAMKLQMPADAKDPKDSMRIRDSDALTILLGSDNSVYYYEGKFALDGSNLKPSNYHDIRNVIINKRKTSDSAFFMVVIKPMPESNYRNTVDILDEMTINEIHSYAMVDASAEEARVVAMQNVK
jgi:biopolymer transport protein ExbD